MNGNIEFISNAMFILLWKGLAGETQLVGSPPMHPKVAGSIPS